MHHQVPSLPMLVAVADSPFPDSVIPPCTGLSVLPHLGACSWVAGSRGHTAPCHHLLPLSIALHHVPCAWPAAHARCPLLSTWQPLHTFLALPTAAQPCKHLLPLPQPPHHDWFWLSLPPHHWQAPASLCPMFHATPRCAMGERLPPIESTPVAQYMPCSSLSSFSPAHHQPHHTPNIRLHCPANLHPVHNSERVPKPHSAASSAGHCS